MGDSSAAYFRRRMPAVYCTAHCCNDFCRVVHHTAPKTVGRSGCRIGRGWCDVVRPGRRRYAIQSIWVAPREFDRGVFAHDGFTLSVLVRPEKSVEFEFGMQARSFGPIASVGRKSKGWSVARSWRPITEYPDPLEIRLRRTRSSPGRMATSGSPRTMPCRTPSAGSRRAARSPNSRFRPLVQPVRHHGRARRQSLVHRGVRRQHRPDHAERSDHRIPDQHSGSVPGGDHDRARTATSGSPSTSITRSRKMTTSGQVTQYPLPPACALP